ncbi:MAG: LPS export ABC transporter periplasmic protein LptC [Alistipes sp.]|nr:LPS export ABC transporter periplasmic protein LptC [Alistipes sp.]
MLALLIVGGASLLSSCESKPSATLYDYETLMTESSENRTITMMENGKRSYTFQSPLMEGYSMASNPYQEFRRGIKMTTYTDSLSLVDATITANYAIYYERQKLWEAKGNVVIIKNNRKGADTTVTGLTEIYTQQLFWNATTKKIYSNVDTKVLQPDGWHFGVGFDADEDLKNIHFRKYTSEMEFDMSQPDPAERAAKEEEKRAKEAEEAAQETKGANGTKGAKVVKSGNDSSTKAPTPLRPAAVGSEKRPTTQPSGASRTGVAADRNISPLPVGKTERPAPEMSVAKDGAVTPPTIPSMGARKGGKSEVSGNEMLTPTQSGSAALKPGASSAKRASDVKGTEK